MSEIEDLQHDLDVAIEKQIIATEEYYEKVADEQVEACVASLKAALCLWLPDDRMDNIIDICRSANLAKRVDQDDNS